jgi:hypothetical protein
METENAESTPRPLLPIAPAAEGAISIAFLACGLWALTVLVQLGSESFGLGHGVLSGDLAGLRAGLAVLWLAAAIGAAIVGKKGLDAVKDSDDRFAGRGEALAAILLSLGTIGLTVLALAIYGIFQALR